MKKVYIEGDALVSVPVKVRFSMLLNADEDCNIEKAVQAFVRGRDYGKADCEELALVHISEVNEGPANVELTDVVDEMIRVGQMKVQDWRVEDSK